jgi:type I restriction enzyme, S subunit
MKEGWEIKRLGEVCSIGDGNYSAKYPKASEFVSSGVPFLTATNLKFGVIVLEGIRYISREQHATLKKGHILKNDLVIVVRGSSTGNNSIVQEEYEGSNLNSQLAFLRIKINDLNSRYLFSVFNSPEVQRVVLDAITGSAQPQLTNNKLLDICIPIPPLPEQKRIVAILDKAFAAIAKAKANAEQNCKNAKEIFEGYLQKVFEDKGEGWEEKMLGEVLVKTESIDPTKKPAEEFIYLDVSSVNKETKQIENATVLLGKDAPSRARKLIKVNDVIFATVRPTHSRIALITKEYDEQVCSTGYFVLRAKEFLDNNLVFYFLLTYSFNKQMQKLQKGASYPAVTDSEVKGIYISFPKSFKIQQSIVKKLDTLSTETKKLESIYKQKINDLEELKKSILEKAFKGEL